AHAECDSGGGASRQVDRGVPGGGTLSVALRSIAMSAVVLSIPDHARRARRGLLRRRRGFRGSLPEHIPADCCLRLFLERFAEGEPRVSGGCLSNAGGTVRTIPPGSRAGRAAACRAAD